MDVENINSSNYVPSLPPEVNTPPQNNIPENNEEQPVNNSQTQVDILA